MRVGIDYGRNRLDLEVAPGKLVDTRRATDLAPAANPSAAMRQALEHPTGFPALRRALTPDDHVAVVLDEQLPQLPLLLTPLFEHLLEAHVRPEAVTFVVPPSAGGHPWFEQLPAWFRQAAVEVHDPADRRRLSYLATTRTGRRVYLNRTAVDADQLVVLARRGYDPLLGYAGSEGAIYPALSDEATRHECLTRLTTAVPGPEPWPIRREAEEVAWLLGAPFMVQVIEGPGDAVAQVLGGLADTGAEGRRLLDEQWRVTADERADTVVAALAGEPARHDFAELARALGCAARVVKPGGRIVLLTAARPELGRAADVLRQADEPGQALGQLRESAPPDAAAAFQWASAAQEAAIYLLSGLPTDLAEELFVVPLEHGGQVQRLLGGGTTLVLPDANKTLAVPANGRVL